MIGRLDLARKWMLLVLVSLITVGPHGALAQSKTTPPASTDHPTFAVSIIRVSGPDSARQFKFQPGGRLVARSVSVRLLIKIAYNLNDDELTGGPSWIGLQHFDIDATPDAPDGSSIDMERNRLRLQGLLADRFQLDLHSEMRTMSTYALVVAKNGPKLKKPQTPDAPMQAHGNIGSLTLMNATLDQFANAVSDWVGHTVLNQTGLNDKYDLRLEWTPDQGTPAAQADTSTGQPDYSGPTIFTALQQQLGLSLESRKNQALCKVVQRVELPTEN
jgi:bla regulator protein blaR1